MKKMLCTVIALALALAMMTCASAEVANVPVIKFTVSTQSSEGDWNDYFSVKYIEEKFNVDLQFEMISSDIWNEKYPLLFASDNLPDVFFSNVDAAKYGAEGFLLPLEELVNEEDTPNIWKMWQGQPLLKAVSTELDGHIYYLQGMDACKFELDGNRFFINIDWADRILGHMPTTLDELHEYLVGVKENDMDGDGDETNEVPLGGAYGLNYTVDCMIPIIAAMGHVTFEAELQDDGNVIWVATSEDFKEFLKYMNMLWTEELMEPEFFTFTEDQYKAKDSTGVYGAGCAWAPYSNHPDGDDYRKYDLIEPMTSEFNDVKMAPSMSLRTNGGFSITSVAEDPEFVISVLDWFFSDEACDRITNGYFELGENEEYPDFYYNVLTDETGSKGFALVNKDGVEALPEGFESETAFRVAEIAPNYGAMPTYRYYEPIRLTEKHIWFIYHVIEYHSPYARVAMPTGIKYTVAESDELALIKADVSNYYNEMVTKMIRGDVDIDEVWDEYVAGMNERGVERALEIYQEGYNRFSDNIA